MPNRSWSLLVLLVSAWVLTPAACTSARPASAREEGRQEEAALVELRKRVEAFAVGIGDEAAFSRLKQMPREELLASLDKLRQETEDDDPLRVKIAFLMCRLNHDYDENRAIVASYVSLAPPFYQLQPDETIGFVDDLIERGDEKLIPVVVAAAEWADGAVAEAVCDILYKEAVRDVDSILKNLVNTSAPTREAVYLRLRQALRDNDAGKKKLLRRLGEKSRDKDLGPLAEEMARNIARSVE